MARKIELPEVSIDMTPMIDVVFNLLIFFMLVNNMVQDERAELELPIADQSKEEKMIDKRRLIINVHKRGVVEISGVEVGSEQMGWSKLARILLEEARVAPKDKEGNPTRSVLIRGDIGAPYKIVQKVMVECARQKIHKISFAAKPPEE